jgi:hypothetical protein
MNVLLEVENSEERQKQVKPIILVFGAILEKDKVVFYVRNKENMIHFPIATVENEPGTSPCFYPNSSPNSQIDKALKGER